MQIKDDLIKKARATDIKNPYIAFNQIIDEWNSGKILD